MKTRVSCVLLHILVFSTGGQSLCLQGCECDEQKAILKCQNGSFENVPQDIPSYVQKIHLSGNKLQQLGSRIFYKGIHATFLDVSSNAIDDIASDAFWNLRRSLRTLILKGNRLKQIPKSALSQLPLLTTLSLAHNDLELLPTRSFENLGSIKSLDLRGNWIEQILSNAFYGLNKLVHLDLSGNKLVTLTASSLRNLNSLVKLDLSENAITQLHQNSFTHTTFLEELNLSGNILEEVIIGGSCETGRLKMLDLSLNKLTKLHAGMLNCMEKLENLIFKGNKIATIEENSFNDMINLKRLDLSKNQLPSIPNENAWKDLKRLENISFSENNISSLPCDLFGLSSKKHSMAALRHIDVSFNSLTNIEDASFNAFVGLQILNLEHNHINAISGDAFTGNPILERIYLGYNRLQTPNFSWFRTGVHVSFKTVNFSNFLTHNPWSCNCGLYQQLTQVSNASLGGVECFSPNWVRGRSLEWYLENNPLHCGYALGFYFLYLLLIAFFGVAVIIFTRIIITKSKFPVTQGKVKRIRLDSYKRDKIL